LKRLLPVLLLLLVGVAIWRWQVSKDDGPRQKLTYSGVVEATTVECAFEIAGTVLDVRVQEGQEVRKGELLARLDRRSWEAALAQAQARAGAAQARYEQLRNGFRPSEIGQAQARVEAASAELQQIEAGPTSEEIESARAQMEAARQRASLTQEGSRTEDIASARSQVQGARINLQTADREYQRFARLHSQGAVSSQQLEARRNQLAQARSTYDVADQTYRRLQSGPRSQERQSSWSEYRSAAARYQDLANGSRPEQVARAAAVLRERERALQTMQEGPRKEEITAARRQWDEARAAVQQATVQMSKANLYAPLSGRITARNLEPGEAVSPGVSVLTLADLGNPWINIYIPETELARVRIGQKGQISADGLGTPVSGSVQRIYEKAEFTPKFIQTPRERVNLVYRAKVGFANSEMRLHPGQPVDVELTP
jgi:HlyD family secretion protein